MPYLVAANGGCLRGKRILDIACNSGFWSIQCALLGAEVVGFDGRAELIRQADLIKSIVGVDDVQFRVLDFWDMSRQALGGTFDIVLNLGILCHLPDLSERYG
jgi:2-polyprenyl-3-methyl-5-hydroxy-6-metoxy-1,4-benzoquinol methylase